MGNQLGNQVWPPQGSSATPGPGATEPRVRGAHAAFPSGCPREGGCLGFSFESTGFTGRWRSARIRLTPAQQSLTVLSVT